MGKIWVRWENMGEMGKICVNQENMGGMGRIQLKWGMG